MTVAIDASMYQQVFEDLEIEETGSYKEPHNKFFVLPRMFVVAADGSAREFLTEEQLDYAMRTKEV